MILLLFSYLAIKLSIVESSRLMSEFPSPFVEQSLFAIVKLETPQGIESLEVFFATIPFPEDILFMIPSAITAKSVHEPNLPASIAVTAVLIFPLLPTLPP